VIQRFLPPDSMTSPAAQTLGSLLHFLPYQTFNKVQEAVIPALFSNDYNCLVAAPTGSGKTVLLEVAMLRLFRHRLQSKAQEVVNSIVNDISPPSAVGESAACRGRKFKAVYICPIKALANEKYEHWRSQFPSLSVVIETGDQMLQRDANLKTHVEDGNGGSAVAEAGGGAIGTWEDMSTVSQADILVTTPERWDSITRRWKEKEVMAIVHSVGLLLLDEVHTVQEERGAAMEAIVSRVKAIQSATAHDAVNGSPTRLVAISGTLPNIRDMAEWLGVLPQMTFAFSAADRPVPLTIKVISYAHDTANPFAFHRFLSFKLFALVQQFSEGRPTLVFCASRKEVTSTAAQLVEDIRGAATRRGQLAQLQPSDATRQLAQQAADRQLRSCLLTGVGFHHAAMTTNDRHLVERMFREQYIAVVCSTTTLALGVNLPAHLVVVKGTTHFANGQCLDVSVSEVMQMCGRAGRPGLDAHGVALVLTTQRKSHIYDTLRNGTVTLTPVESHLHRHMIEHVNAEVALRTIQSFHSAMDWAKTTFFWIRLRECPRHYGLAFANQAEEDEFSAEAFVEALMERVLRVLLEEGCICAHHIAGRTGEAAPLSFLVQPDMLTEHGDSASSEVPSGDIRQPGVVLEPTRLGRAMSRMYVLFDTVCTLNAEIQRRGVEKGKPLLLDSVTETTEAEVERTEGEGGAEEGVEGNTAAFAASSRRLGPDGAAGKTTATEENGISMTSAGAAVVFTLQETLQLLCQCQELVEVRLRQGDRGPLNEINRAVRFPLHSGRRGGREVREDWHKAYILIQAHVGLLPITEVSLRNDATRLWSVVPRVARFLEEYAWVQTSSYSLACCANVLARCVERRVWPDGPVLRQLPHVSDAVAKSMLRGGFYGFETLQHADARQLEVLCSRLPPFGSQVLAHVRVLPHLRIELHINALQEEARARRVGGPGSTLTGTVRVLLLRGWQNRLFCNSESATAAEGTTGDVRGAQSVSNTTRKQGGKSASTEASLHEGRILLVVGVPAADVVLLKRFVSLVSVLTSAASPAQTRRQVPTQLQCSDPSLRAQPADTAEAGETEVAVFTFAIPVSVLQRDSSHQRRPEERCTIEARCFVLHMVGLDVAARVACKTPNVDAGIATRAAASSSTMAEVAGAGGAANMHTPTLDQYWMVKPALEKTTCVAETTAAAQKQQNLINVEQTAVSREVAAEARESFNALLADMAYVASDDNTKWRQTRKKRKRLRGEETSGMKPLPETTPQRPTEPHRTVIGTTPAPAAEATEADLEAGAAGAEHVKCSRQTSEERKGGSLLPPSQQPRTESLATRRQQSPTRTEVLVPDAPLITNEAGADSVPESRPASLCSPLVATKLQTNGAVLVRLPRCASPPATRPSPQRRGAAPSAAGRFSADAMDSYASVYSQKDLESRWDLAACNPALNYAGVSAYNRFQESREEPRRRFLTEVPMPVSSRYPAGCVPAVTPGQQMSFHVPYTSYAGRYERAAPHAAYDVLYNSYAGNPGQRGFSDTPFTEADGYSSVPAAGSHRWLDAQRARGMRWPSSSCSQAKAAGWQCALPSDSFHPRDGMLCLADSLRPAQPPTYAEPYSTERRPFPHDDRTRVVEALRWPTEESTPRPPPTPPLPTLPLTGWPNALSPESHERSVVAPVRQSVPRPSSLTSEVPPPQWFRYLEQHVPSYSATVPHVHGMDVSFSPWHAASSFHAMPATQPVRGRSSTPPLTRPFVTSSAGGGGFTPHVRRSAMVSHSWWQ
jgi:ATP-dependent DNA helicase HFM1/MER3